MNTSRRSQPRPRLIRHRPPVPPEGAGQLVLYHTEDGRTRISVRLIQESVWLTLNQIADLFQRDKSVISKHIKNIFESGELRGQRVPEDVHRTALGLRDLQTFEKGRHGRGDRIRFEFKLAAVRRLELNAQQSTGPRSVEGKAVVSMNALQSGLDAKSVIIRGESSADFETLTTQYYDRWLPTAPEQRALVDALIASEWLNRRYLRLEAQLWEDCMPSPERLRPKTFLSQALYSGDHLFDKLARHKNSALRNYHTTLRALDRLKQKEQPKGEPAAPSPGVGPLNPTPIAPHPRNPFSRQPLPSQLALFLKKP